MATADSSRGDVVSDEKLVELFRAGDISAFNELVRRYEQSLLKYLIGLTGDYDLACDCKQEAVVKVYFWLLDTQEPICFKAFLYRVAINLVKNHWKKSRRLIRWFVLGEQEEHNADCIPEGICIPGPEQRAESMDFVGRLLKEVSKKCRPCLCLDIFEDMTQREIAKLLGIGERTVRRYIKSGKDELCKAYDRLAEQDPSMRRRSTR